MQPPVATEIVKKMTYMTYMTHRTQSPAFCPRHMVTWFTGAI